MKDTELQKQVLQLFYDRKREGCRLWSRNDSLPGVDWIDFFRVVEQLGPKPKGLGFLDWEGTTEGTGAITVHGVGQINAVGVRCIELGENQNGQSNHLVVNGMVLGGIQYQSPNSTQTVSVALTKIEDSVKNLGELIGRSSASEMDREEAMAALQRIRQLAEKPKSDEVVAKAKEKLELVKNTIGTAVELSKIAAPYIAILANHFA